MLESFTTDKFEYKHLSPEEQQKRGILGRLVGVIADTKNKTRNDRKYGLNLWKKVFDDPIMKEKIANRCVFSELGHPEDRAEIDMGKVCACLAEQPKLGKDGKLYGVFDILDTPNGKLLKTLCDYGTTVGISSRGTGDLYTDENGDEAVDPDTYQCECFDVVLIPAVESARLQFVNEDYKGKTLKQALKEQLDRSNEEEQKVMKETLEKLELDEGIEAAKIETEDQVIEVTVTDKEEESNLPEQGDYINRTEVSEVEETDEPEEAEDFGLEEVVENLQKTLKRNRELEKKVESLQTKLSVSNAKEARLNEDVTKYKQSTQNLTRQLLALKEKHSASETTAKQQADTIQNLKEQLAAATKAAKSQKAELDKLQLTITQLQESLDAKVSLVKQYTNKLTQARDLVEKYKKISREVSNKYIESQAQAYGLDKQQILNRLNESFTFTDVDKVCEALSARKLRVNKLPFDLSRAVKVTTQTTSPSLLGNNSEDDVVDESLLRLANL